MKNILNSWNVNKATQKFEQLIAHLTLQEELPLQRIIKFWAWSL